jgi:hypothetical protein
MKKWSEPIDAGYLSVTALRLDLSSEVEEALHIG